MMKSRKKNSLKRKQISQEGSLIKPVTQIMRQGPPIKIKYNVE